MDSPIPAESPEGVNFLTALLIRFPEIGSASLRHGGAELDLDFYLHRRLDDDEVALFDEHLRLSWDAFFFLQRIRPELLDFMRTGGKRPPDSPGPPLPWEQEGDDTQMEVDSIRIVRDLATITVEELSLLVALVREGYEDDLALNEDAPSDDPGQHEEMIHRSLEKVRSVPGEAALTGFRDDMRVLIYASQEPD